MNQKGNYYSECSEDNRIILNTSLENSRYPAFLDDLAVKFSDKFFIAYDAIYFCNKFSEMCGLEPVYKVDGNTDVTKWNYIPDEEKYIKGTIEQDTSKNGYRLPTVAEWELAARGGLKGGWDYKYSGSNSIGAVAWYEKNSSEETHEVGKKKPNAAGLYDMSGNVREWCWDIYPDYSNCRYYRGGGYRDYAHNCEVGYRDRIDGDVSFGGDAARAVYGDLGFRIVCSVSD